MTWKSIARGVVAVSILLPSLTGIGLAAEEKKTKLSAEDEVIALEMARGDALMKADTTALAQMTADEFFEISRLGTLRTKADNLRDLASGELKLTTVKYEDLTVKVYGAAAVLRGVADNTGTYRGFPFQGKIRYMRVFVKRNNRWQAVAMQHTAI